MVGGVGVVASLEVHPMAQCNNLPRTGVLIAYGWIGFLFYLLQ